MLVCNVSLRPPRTAIAATVAEVASAVDATATGNVVFATLVDDPANVGDLVDAYLGEIMLEAANADTVVDAGLVFGAEIDEAVTAIAAEDGTTVPAGGVLVIGGTPVTTGIEYEHGVGSSYAGFTVTASDGTAPYTYSVASGTLPTGLTLNSSTGAVSGTPGFESAGTYSGIVIRVTDAASGTADLASFTLTIAYKDPYYSSTKLLLDHNAADGTTTFTDASAASRGNGTAAGNVQHDTGVSPPYGTSWFLFDGSGDAIQYADSNDWNLGTQNFTLDAVIRPNVVTGGNRFLICQWQSSGNLNFVLFQQDAGLWLGVSTTGANSLFDVSALAALTVNTTYHVRLDFDGTKYRLYKNGTMVGSSTTLRSLYTGSNQPLAIGSSSQASGSSYSGHMKGIRITVGVARTASDSGYTISNRALPTS